MTSLGDDLTRHGVDLTVEVADWRALTRHVGAMLVDAGLARDDYTAAMIDNVERNGPYVVIAPGLALLHARPEEGAIAPGIVLAVPCEPVVFGHSTNDPVRVALGLTAVDDTGHLDALTTLATVFSAPDAVERVTGVTDPNDLAAVLTELGGTTPGEKGDRT